MDDITAVGIAEGFYPSKDKKHEIEAWQHLIDTGLCWQLQGWFGRTAQSLIESGVCSSPNLREGSAIAPDNHKT